MSNFLGGIYTELNDLKQVNLDILNVGDGITITESGITTNYLNGIDSTTIGYLNGVTSSIQDQINSFQGFTYKGVWDPTSTYKKNDIVSLNGSSYVSLLDNNKEIVDVS